MKITKIIKTVMIALPLCEIAVFIIVGSFIGVIPVLLLMIAGAFLGSAILRTQGILQFQQVQSSLKKGEHPSLSLMEAAMVILAGILLIIPGFITDVIALLLLIPSVRYMLLKWLLYKGYISTYDFKKPDQEDHRVIEGEWQREDDDKKNKDV